MTVTRTLRPLILRSIERKYAVVCGSWENHRLHSECITHRRVSNVILELLHAATRCGTAESHEWDWPRLSSWRYTWCASFTLNQFATRCSSWSRRLTSNIIMSVACRLRCLRNNRVNRLAIVRAPEVIHVASLTCASIMPPQALSWRIGLVIRSTIECITTLLSYTHLPSARSLRGKQLCIRLWMRCATAAVRRTGRYE